ncbi:MAG: hypothetical protein AAGI10_02135 [Pseudomonadota bacterium]
MTALKDYAKLETSGLWRSGPDAQRRNVGVSFGNATLVISDNAGKPLTHWSLAAVHRINPKNTPALFAPDEGENETLELDDADMILAIEQVQRAISRARPKPGRLRWTILAASAAAIVALGVFWLPGALIKQAVTVVPDVKRAEIGTALMGRMARLTGQPCADPFGTVALRRLQGAIAPENRLHILRQGLTTTASLPGGHILIARQVLEDHDDPSVPAGYVVAELTRTAIQDPLDSLLRTSGAYSAFRLLTTGTLPDDVLDAYAESLLTAPDRDVPEETLIFAFQEAQVTTRPYAYALDVTGETTVTLIEADPFNGVPPVNHLSDGDWLSLQGICLN